MTAYDVAQICENGHVTNDSVKGKPQRNQKYCEHCGKPTITKCPKCNTPIRGHLYSPHITLLDSIDAPRFCIACGNPFTWFETKVNAAKELAGMHKDLNDKERELLKKSFDDLIEDNAKSEVAAIKIKPILLNKLKQGAQDTLYRFAIDVASETSKKILMGNDM
ncbi:MAG: DUF2321 domain-containing protein [Thermoproteota archaeon]|nr:DUF2321 domain-containing protein [Thermoproteota archaeon]